MERFEEWFAVRIGHKDDEYWPSRLVYDPLSGITLDTINYAKPDVHYHHPTFEADTITGYIDYQQPATVISSFVQEYNPGSWTVGWPMRARFKVRAHGILKNIHLEDLAEKCFVRLHAQIPSFHAWIAPGLLKANFTHRNNLPSTIQVEIDEASVRQFCLRDGVEVDIVTYAAAEKKTDNLPITQNTGLSLKFKEPIDYSRITRIQSNLDVMFNFLIGVRLETAVHRLDAIVDGERAGTKDTVLAEAWFVPAWKREAVAPSRHSRMLVEANSTVGPDRLLEICLGPNSNLIYLMGVVLSIEMQDVRIDDGFIELLGCLEDFDEEQYGSGTDPNLRLAARRIRRLVRKNGTNEDNATCDLIWAGFRNKFSLAQRLNRLVSKWNSDGFRGAPNISRIVQIRNIKPHGRGRELSIEIYAEIVEFCRLLCAIARYHVLSVLGFSPDEIGRGFARVPFRYGPFVPAHLVPVRNSDFETQTTAT
jgi:hypothetical protein